MVGRTGSLADMVEEVFVALRRRAGQEFLGDGFLHRGGLEDASRDPEPGDQGVLVGLR